MRNISALGLVAVIATAVGATAPIATAAPPAGAGGAFLLTTQEMAQARSHLDTFSSVLSSCDKGLSGTAHPVASLTLKNHYDANGKSGSNEENTLAEDATTVYKLGLCYQLTGKMQYATQAQKMIDAWATTLKSAPTSQGKDAINFAMPAMIGGATWVKGVGGWDGRTFSAFLDKVALPNNLLSNPNNHGMWAVLMVASAAAYGGNPKLMAVAEKRWQQIVAGEVRSDGTMPQEMARSDTSDYKGGPTKGIRGIAYTHYTLLPMSMSAKLFADAGQSVWKTSGGQLLGKAFAKAAEWTVNPQTFPYYASNHGKLQDTQNGSYFPLLLRTYPNADAVKAVTAGDTKANTFLLPELFPTTLTGGTSPTLDPASTRASSQGANAVFPAPSSGAAANPGHVSATDVAMVALGTVALAGSAMYLVRRRTDA